MIPIPIPRARKDARRSFPVPTPKMLRAMSAASCEPSIPPARPRARLGFPDRIGLRTRKPTTAQKMTPSPHPRQGIVNAAVIPAAKPTKRPGRGFGAVPASSHQGQLGRAALTALQVLGQEGQPSLRFVDGPLGIARLIQARPIRRWQKDLQQVPLKCLSSRERVPVQQFVGVASYQRQALPGPWVIDRTCQCCHQRSRQRLRHRRRVIGDKDSGDVRPPSRGFLPPAESRRYSVTTRASSGHNSMAVAPASCTSTPPGG